MKQWEMNIKGTTHVKVLADSYEEAINKGLLYIEQENIRSQETTYQNLY